jgi:hypothetical protein
LTTALTFSAPQIVDITDKLPKKQSWDTLPNKQNIVRGMWDGTYHKGLRNPEDVDTIIIHHSGPPEGTLVSHANYHAQQWGAGIAYHVAIDEGLIKQLNDLLSFTFHAGGHNTYTVGIVVNADLSKRELTDRERELLYAAILTVKSILPIKQILGHNEVNPTACPCTSVDRIRNDIAKLELQMKSQVDPEQAMAKAYKATNQHNWIFGEYKKDPVGKKWLEPYLLKMDEITKEMGMYFDK